MANKSTTIQTFVEDTQAFKIYTLMLQGKTIYEIAEELKTAEENIRGVIAKEKLKMTAGMQEMQEAVMAMTYARTEWLLSKVFPVIEKHSQDGTVDKNLIKTALDILKFQNEVVSAKDADKKSGSDVVINQTFVGGSTMYDEAMQEMQSEFIQSIRVEREIPMQMAANPDIIRLEALAEKHGVKLDGNTDESDEEHLDSR